MANRPHNENNPDKHSFNFLYPCIRNTPEMNPG